MATQLAGYFGAVFLFAMGALFVMWYFGLPQFSMVGASDQRIGEATRLLEAQADFQRSLLLSDLAERRGDVLVISENKVLNQQLTTGDLFVQHDLMRIVERLRRAYPDRYEELLIVHPVTAQVIASSNASEVGKPFRASALVQQAAQPGLTEIVDQVPTEKGIAIAVVRQMRGLGEDGYPDGPLAGILVALVSPLPLMMEGPGQYLGGAALYDAAGQKVAQASVFDQKNAAFVPKALGSSGFEGAMTEKDEAGEERLVVYRHLPLSGMQGWTLVRHMNKAQALDSLKNNANRLLGIGFLLAMAALVFVFLLARRLAQPMQELSSTARAFGSGDFAARAILEPGASREAVALAQAFNRMAENIELGRQVLESAVEERTLELAEERDRAQGYLDIADVMLVALDLQGCISMINRFGAEMLGLPESALIGMNWIDNFVPADESMAVHGVLDGLVQGGDASFQRFRNHIRTFSGQLRLLSWSNAVVRDESGDVVGILSSAEDITERNAADEELRIAAIAFESQEGIFVTGADWRILRVNGAFSSITGYTAEESAGQLPGELLGSGYHDADFYLALSRGVAQDGKWQGEVWDKRKNGEIYPAWLVVTAVTNGEGRVSHYVVSMSDITARKAADDEIKSLAFYDPLTSLPNRRLLMDRLGLALAGVTRHQRKGALFFVDLDDFKTLNDTLGHDKGDLLLQQVAQRLVSCTREGDTVARLGGDEFVLLLEDLSENALDAATQAEAVGEKILATLNSPYEIAGMAHHSSPSIGITLFGEHAESIDEPLKRADLAMYQAKAAGRNTLRFFDPKMQIAVAARASLESSLRDAVNKQQMVLYYQSQVVGEGDITGAEVLVRWLHPERGMVAPGEFIPVAEETGVIVELGHWVLETACKQLAAWAAQPLMQHLTLSVNVSARQFRQDGFVDSVREVLQRTGANARLLKLELTESVLVTEVEETIGKMNLLKAQGVGFSLDDFGTGYSSLAYLKRMPLDQLKIDQGFVRDILVDSNDAAIASIVVTLAHSMGLEVIAEGVETEAQRAFLEGQGCQAYQGYFFSRPVPIAEFEALL